MLPTATKAARENQFTKSLAPLFLRPRHVLLDERALAALAEQLAQDQFVVPSWRELVFPPTDDEVFVNFIGVGNAINFAFTDFETHKSFRVRWREREWRGAFAMWACLARAREIGVNVLDATILKSLTLQGFNHVFSGDPPIPLAEERLKHLREIGAVLKEHYCGTFWNLIQVAQFTAFGTGGILERLIGDFRSFRDAGVHNATAAQFHKRAQLFAMMYEGRARNSDKLPRLCDSDLLGPIADYDIPRVLHAAGVLKYSAELEYKVKKWIPLAAYSLEEIEIRAQATHAQTLLLTRINELRNADRIDFLALDYKLWTVGRQLKEPHHLSETTAY